MPPMLRSMLVDVIPTTCEDEIITKPDILTYDDAVGTFGGVQLPRDEILENAFVLCPLAELAPQRLHPRVQRSYQSLWDTYDRTEQPLHKVDFIWRGRVISTAD